MPTIKVNGAGIFYEEFGSGRETIVFAHGLLMNHTMFEEQINALKDQYRCIAFDFRGQGKSEVSKEGYDMETLFLDTAELIQQLNAAPCHFAGLSMGGFVGLRLGIRKPELLKSLILIETSADPEPDKNLPKYKTLNFIARWFGLKLVINQVLPILFAEPFLTDPEKRSKLKIWKKNILSNHRIGITKAVKGVIYREGVSNQIHQIKVPTLIIVGEQDVATVPEKSKKMHSLIENSKLEMIPNAGHSSTIEEPKAVSKAIINFLEAISG